ncbi:MBL fold metallo-hydrolase [Brumimicrobium mesophilum]|uniref:MBL fold metallo-hydrolase n=1 Tax=Brumimicrobium mesophilum TaxID=392717 RepID=UPI00131B82B3|nr:hypothetical protein [Brumimicrobium mesophilum]
MKLSYTILIFVLGMIFSFTGIAQSNEIKIKFIGNCGLHMTDGELNIYSDFPYKSGAFGYMKFDDSEIDSIRENSIFIFTHKHADHYSGKNMRKTLRSKGGKKYGPWNIKKLKQFAESTHDFEIETFKTKHRFSFNHYSYLITWHGKKIFLSGDTESAETIGEIKNMDMAFLPSWIYIDAKEKGIKIDAKKIGLYHLYPNEKITGDIPEKITILQNQKTIIPILY